MEYDTDFLWNTPAKLVSDSGLYCQCHVIHSELSWSPRVVCIYLCLLKDLGSVAIGKLEQLLQHPWRGVCD